MFVECVHECMMQKYFTDGQVWEWVVVGEKEQKEGSKGKAEGKEREGERGGGTIKYI